MEELKINNSGNREGELSRNITGFIDTVKKITYALIISSGLISGNAFSNEKIQWYKRDLSPKVCDYLTNKLNNAKTQADKDFYKKEISLKCAIK